MIFKLSISALILLGSCPCDGASARKNRPDPYVYLDGLALEAGIDKSSSFHNYTKVYAKYFDCIRDKPIRFLEICRVNSEKLWEPYFPKGELHFINIVPSFIESQNTAVHHHFIDAIEPTPLQALAQLIGGDLDIIIDDGSHRMQDQITSFKTLFPYVKSGGMYIIEDLHTSYWSEYGGHGKIGKPASGPGTCISLLKNLIDELNYTSGVSECADFNKLSEEIRANLNAYQEHIDSMHFYKSLCIILKK